MSTREAVFILAVVVIGVAAQVAFDSLLFRPISLAILGLLLLGLLQWFRSRARR